METIYNSNIYNFGSSSALHLILQYEKQRSGADMLYRFYYKVYIADRNGNPNPYGRYDNNLRLSFTLNGGGVWFPETGSHSSSGWSSEQTSGWVTISNKTSGTTPLTVKVDDTINASWCHFTSGTFDLPIDPAGSDLGAINNFNIGTAFTVPIIKYASMYDVLAIKINSTTITTIENASSSNLISFTQAQLNTIYGLTTQDQSKVFTFELKTYENYTKTTQVGVTKTKTARGYIVGANPVINSKSVIDVLQDTIDLTGDATKLIKYKSTAKISVNVSGIYQATISSVKINNTNSTYNSTSGNWELEIQNAQTDTFLIEVRDSRNFVTNDSLTATMVNYIPLTVNVTATRNQPTDGKINLAINGNYFNDTFGDESNTLSVKYRYIEYGGTYQDNWQTLTPTITDNTYSITTQLSNFDYQKQYEFEVQVEDLLEIKDVTEIKVGKGKPVFNWGDDFFNINGELRINEVALSFYPVGSIYMSVNNTNPSTYFGGTWVAWGSGRVPVGVNTNETEFNTVEKTGGSKALQQHTHSARLNNNGNHKHSMKFGGNAGSGDGNIVSIAGVYYGNDYGSMTEGEHDHGGITVDNAGSGDSGNLQPYITCYMFKRTA